LAKIISHKWYFEHFLNIFRTVQQKKCWDVIPRACDLPSSGGAIITSLHSPNSQQKKFNMAAHSLAASYQNFSINDVFGKPKSSSNLDHLQHDTEIDFMNESRFAVPSGCDVSVTDKNRFVTLTISYDFSCFSSKPINFFNVLFRFQANFYYC